MTVDELTEVVVSRTFATGRLCAVAGFTSASRAHVVDFDDDGEVAAAWSVPVDEPDRLSDGPEADAGG